jgi:hypothetical protein
MIQLQSNVRQVDLDPEEEDRVTDFSYTTIAHYSHAGGPYEDHSRSPTQFQHHLLGITNGFQPYDSFRSSTPCACKYPKNGEARPDGALMEEIWWAVSAARVLLHGSRLGGIWGKTEIKEYTDHSQHARNRPRTASSQSKSAAG